MKNLAFMLILVIFCLSSCSKDDDNSKLPENLSGLDLISGEEGSIITVKISNEPDKTYSGNNVEGWNTVNVLNSNLMSRIEFFYDNFETISTRFFIPSDISIEDAVEGTNALLGYNIPLEDTQQLDGVYAHMYIYSGSGFESTDFTGTITIQKNLKYGDILYDMVGTFEISSGSQTITGVFWKKDVTQW